MNEKHRIKRQFPGPAIAVTLAVLFALLLSGLQASAQDSSRGLTAAGSHAPADQSTGSLLVTIYDGTRRPVAAGTTVLLRVFDGKQKEIVSGFYKGPAVQFNGLPIHDNLDDTYRVVASMPGYNTDGVAAVQVRAGKTAGAEVMLLPHHGQIVFDSWSSLRQNYPWLAGLLAQGTASDRQAESRYKRLMAEDPGALAALLNITTAGRQIDLDQGNFLSYFKEVVWEEQRSEWREHHMVCFSATNDSEHSMRHDRFWAYADRRLVEQVKLGVAEGRFFVEYGAHVFHPGATGSFKENTMEEGHIHVSFYENDSRVIDGVDCILLEIHIDLYKDLLAHGLLEVVPNTLTSHVTEPEDAYQHRWIASINSGKGGFNPPLTIVPHHAGKWHRHNSVVKTQ